MKRRITILHVRKKLWHRPTVVDETPLQWLTREFRVRATLPEPGDRPIYEYAAVYVQLDGRLNVTKGNNRASLASSRYVFIRRRVETDRVWYFFYDVAPPHGQTYHYFLRIRDDHNETHYCFQTNEGPIRDLAQMVGCQIEQSRPREFRA